MCSSDLKENIIIGHPIPAGTGMKRYRDIKLYDENQQDLDEYLNEILEKRKLAKTAELVAEDFSIEDAEVDAESEPEIIDEGEE